MNFNKFWWKLSWHNGLDLCRFSEFYLKSCVFDSLSKICLSISQAGKSAYVCQDLVMRKTSYPFLNVSYSKTVCSTNFKFGGSLDQGHCYMQRSFCINLSCIMPFVELFVMLNRVTCIKISWKFASNIKAFFSSFQAISDLSFGGLVDHYLTIADVKNEKNSLIT